MRKRSAAVLVTGMGGELGSLVARHLEDEPWVGELVGVDLEPPRRRLRRATFHLVDPHERRRVAQLVREADPTVIVHAGVYEPGARTNAASAAHRSSDGASAVFGQVANLTSLRGIVLRSGIEVYGRLAAGASPDEGAPVDPTSTFGRILAGVEHRALDAARTAGVTVTLVRLAPVVGPHVPSPLGRLLRLPVVPFEPLRSVSFSVVHLEDAARSLVAAARRIDNGQGDGAIAGAVNVVGHGTLSPYAALRLGGRVGWPVVGPGWSVAQRVVHAIGAPVPDHVVELLTRGRVADGRFADRAGLAPERSTEAAIRALYAWESVTHVRPGEARDRRFVDDADDVAATRVRPARSATGARSKLRVVS